MNTELIEKLRDLLETIRDKALAEPDAELRNDIWEVFDDADKLIRGLKWLDTRQS